MKKIKNIIKNIYKYFIQIFYIDENTKDMIQNLELKEDGYLYLGTE